MGSRQLSLVRIAAVVLALGATACKRRVDAEDGARLREAGAGGATLASSVKVIVFDVFGTVVDWRGSLIAEAEALGKKLGREIDGERFADTWAGTYPTTVQRIVMGEMPWKNLDEILADSLPDVLKEMGLDDIPAADKERLATAWVRLKAWPDTVSGLTRLATRYKIAPLSNANLAMMRRLKDSARLPWTEVISVESVKRFKPDDAAYLLPSQHFGVRPSEVLMVAAHRWDLERPPELGMRTAFVHRAGEEPGEGAITPDLAVRDFEELATALGLPKAAP